MSWKSPETLIQKVLKKVKKKSREVLEFESILLMETMMGQMGKKEVSHNLP